MSRFATDSLDFLSGQNQMLVQKQAQDQTEITNHLETLAQRDTEIRNLRLDIQKVGVNTADTSLKC